MNRYPRTVMVVDPERASRASVCAALSSYDFRAYQAQDAWEAQALADTLGGPLHVLVTELGLPDADGLTLVRKLAARRPMMQAIVVSPLCDDLVCMTPDLLDRVHFLRKPVKKAALVTKVKTLCGVATTSVAATARHTLEMRTRRRVSEPPEVRALIRLVDRLTRVRTRAHHLVCQTECARTQSEALVAVADATINEICACYGDAARNFV